MCIILEQETEWETEESRFSEVQKEEAPDSFQSQPLEPDADADADAEDGPSVPVREPLSFTNPLLSRRLNH